MPNVTMSSVERAAKERTNETEWKEDGRAESEEDRQKKNTSLGGTVTEHAHISSDDKRNAKIVLATLATHRRVRKASRPVGVRTRM